MADSRGAKSFFDAVSEDCKVEVAISAAGIAAIDKADNTIVIDDHVAQRSVAVHDDKVLRGLRAHQPRKQGGRIGVDIARGEFAGIDVAGAYSRGRARETSGQRFIEQTIGDWKRMKCCEIDGQRVDEVGRRERTCFGGRSLHRVGQ